MKEKITKDEFSKIYNTIKQNKEKLVKKILLIKYIVKM